MVLLPKGDLDGKMTSTIVRLGPEGGLNTYAYADGSPTTTYDPYGLFSLADLPSIPQPVLDFSVGVADSASLGIGPLARSYLGQDGGVNQCSSAYSAGQWSSLVLGASRLAYAGIAKVGAAVSVNGATALAFRNGLKRVMRGPFAGSNYRIKDYSEMIVKYGSDDAIKAAAGRTNSAINSVGANLTIGSGLGRLNCECPR